MKCTSKKKLLWLGRPKLHTRQRLSIQNAHTDNNQHFHQVRYRVFQTFATEKNSR